MTQAKSGVFQFQKDHRRSLKLKKGKAVIAESVRVSDLFNTLQEKYHLNPHQRLTITFDVAPSIDYDDEVNVGDDLIAGFKEIIAAKQNGIELPNARDLLRDL